MVNVQAVLESLHLHTSDMQCCAACTWCPRFMLAWEEEKSTEACKKRVDMSEWLTEERRALLSDGIKGCGPPGAVQLRESWTMSALLFTVLHSPCQWAVRANGACLFARCCITRANTGFCTEAVHARTMTVASLNVCLQIMAA